MLADLPLELQTYILIFLPARTLVKTLGRTDRHFSVLVDVHFRRYIRRILSVGPYSDSLRSETGGVALEFEAQRPIDTVTAKHTLHFSHFTDSNVGHDGNGARDSNDSKVPLSRAIFSFSEMAESEIAGRASLSPEQRYAEQRRYSGSAFQPFIPTLHPDDLHRVSRGIWTSSVEVRNHLQGCQTPEGSAAPTPAADDAEASTSTDPPFPFLRTSLPNNNQAHPPPPPIGQGNAAWSARQRFTTTLSPTETSTMQSLEMPLDAYDWQGPSGASLRTSLATFGSSAAGRPACYAFQLDPLDSFESLILTLSARKCTLDIAEAFTGRTSGRKVKYHHTIAEGLDRVFRSFFVSPSPPPLDSGPSGSQDVGEGSSNSGGETSTHKEAEAMVASMSTLHSAFGPINRLVPRPPPATTLLPARRQLEFDTPSCLLTIQPHPTFSDLSLHPAHSQPSHDYLYSSLTSHYAALSSHDRVQLTFHCEHVSINAGRLCDSLEVLEDAVVEAEERARCAALRFPTLLVGTSSTTLAWGRDGV